MDFIAQCISGLQEFAAERLHHLPLKNLNIGLVEEGFIKFSTTSTPRELETAKFLNNYFGVMQSFPDRSLNIDAALRLILQSHSWFDAAKRLTHSREKTFQVYVSDSGQLISAGRAALSLAGMITTATGLKLSAHRPDAEFWLIRRRSGRAYFCKRLSRRGRTEKDLQKGELRPELAHLMCLLSDPREEDVFLDPFSGYGAIPFARTTYPYNMMFVVDSQKERIDRIKGEIKLGREFENVKSHLSSALLLMHVN